MQGFSLVFHDPTTQTQRIFHMAPSPEEIHDEEKHLLTLTPLPGLHAVYKESHGPDIGEVQWRGTFGSKRRLVDLIEKDGKELFFDLKKTIWTRYLELSASKDPRVSRGVKIEYHDWAADKHMWAIPTRFLTPRSRDNKTFFRYDIAFQLYAPVKTKLAIKEVGKFEKAVAAYQHFNAAMEELTEIGDWLKDQSAKASNYLQRYVLQPLRKFTQALGAFVSGITSIIALPVRDLARLIDGIASFVEEMGPIVGGPLTESINLLRNVRRSGLRLMNAGELFKDNISTALQDHARFFYKSADPEADSLLQIAEIESGYNAQLRAAAQRVSEGRYQGAQRLRVRQGDTLQKIANKHLNDASKWRDIAMFNGFEGNDDLVPGKDILVPVIPGTEGVVGAGDLGLDRYASQEATTERLYGRDIQVVQDGKGKLDVVFGANNDISSVAGEANLLQAITLKTRIAQGTLLEEPSYGLRRLVGKRAHPFELPALQHGLQVAAESDPRIVEAHVKATQAGNRVDASYNLIPVGMVGRRPISSVVERI